MANRCSCCDYFEGFGSDYANIPSNGKRIVKWSNKFNEYICNVCNREIINAFDNGEDKLSEAQDKARKGTPFLPPLPVK